METIKKISLIGLGAIGSAYANKLVEYDPECIQVIVDHERYERYQSSEISVNGKVIPFRYVTPEEAAEPSDLILVSVKYDGLDHALRDLKPFVGPHTILLSLMNGIESEEMIASVYPDNPVLYAMCIGIDAVRLGSSTRYTKFGEVWFGDASNLSYSPAVQMVKELFDQSQIPYKIPENMLRAMWWKFMINVGVNQTSAVLKAPYGVFQEIEEACQLMADAMREVIQLSEAAGVHLTIEDLEKFYQVLKTLSPEGKTSMLQDIEAGRKTEVENLGGKVCELGRKYGIPTPINEMLFRSIRIMEKMN